MRKIRKKFKKPFRPWDKVRIEEEKKIMKKYGLRRKREIWKAGAILRKFRRRARDITAKNDREGERILIEKLYNLGILESKDVKLDDVLDLKIDHILSRRLQTIVFEKKLANTILHARQLIVHGHIAVDGRRNVFPSYLVPRDKENKIGYYGGFEPKINQIKEEIQEKGE
ncbi:MAG: 30S ribosomal protein S4 [Candidatus Aenigmatarchaeota archaeon]